jgi:hypothetical protein
MNIIQKILDYIASMTLIDWIFLYVDLVIGPMLGPVYFIARHYFA